MSELIQKNDNRATIRWKLLTGASALALAAYVSSAAMAKAEDAGRPQLWIELGGSLNRLQDGQEQFAPPFLALTPSNFSPPQEAARPPLFGFDENAALIFQPKGSDWLFSASIHYGRASSGKHVHHQTYPSAFYVYTKLINGTKHTTFGGLTYPLANRFTDARTQQDENHTIIDFQAGKDVGLGLFGRNASSSLDVGVRFAQFTSKSRVTFAEDPDWQFVTALYKRHAGPNYLIRQEAYQPYHSFAGSFAADRSFRGVGPSLSWKSSMPFAGNSQDGELTLDWGVNGALLFGRQRAQTHHQTTGRYHHHGNAAHHKTPGLAITYQNPAMPTHTRSRDVTVPNAGGFVGLSYNYADAKVSLGYRADFFFNAIDGGIDTRKNENRAFYGPYASISIGLGD